MEFNFDFNLDDNKFETENRIIKRKVKNINEKFIKYANAENLAKDIGMIQENERIHVLLNGSFIFGDFLEAFVVENNLWIKDLTMSTLSLSQDNVESLNNLIEGEFVDNLQILLSDYFYAHERHHLVPYLYDVLDQGKTQIAFADCHTKIFLLILENGTKIVIKGSANLRSSGNIEEMEIEQNANLYDFHKDWHDKIIDKYKTIKKSVRKGKKLWQTVTDITQERMETRTKAES